MTTSSITPKEARKRASAAAAYRPDPAMERVLEWHRQDDPRYDALDPQTRMSVGYYRLAKQAHQAVTTGTKEQA